MTLKSKNIDTHFKRRCIERIGYLPDSNSLIKRIKDNSLEFIKRQSNRVTIWKWIEPINNIPCKLVYDGKRHQIITILFDRENLPSQEIQEGG